MRSVSRQPFSVHKPIGYFLKECPAGPCDEAHRAIAGCVSGIGHLNAHHVLQHAVQTAEDRELVDLFGHLLQRLLLAMLVLSSSEMMKIPTCIARRTRAHLFISRSVRFCSNRSIPDTPTARGYHSAGPARRSPARRSPARRSPACRSSACRSPVLPAPLPVLPAGAMGGGARTPLSAVVRRAVPGEG